MNHIDIKPLSVNEAFKGRRFKTKKYNTFEKEMLLKLPNIKINSKAVLKIYFVFGFTNTLSDIDNPLKCAIDCLQSKYKFNDRNIFELSVKKEITKEPFIKFKIIEL